MLPVSRPYTVDDMMINDYGAVSEERNAMEKGSTQGNPSPWPPKSTPVKWLVLRSIVTFYIYTQFPVSEQVTSVT